MSDLKFRAWDGKQMLLSPAEIQHLGSWFDAHAPGSLYKGGITFMQYTGLKDKNKRDIYEGDIYLATRSYMPSRGYKKKGYPEKIIVICVVEWSTYEAGWACREISPIKEHIEFEKNAPYHYFQTSLMGASDGNADWIEVIGNIYENQQTIN